MPAAICHAPEVSQKHASSRPHQNVLLNSELGSACRLTNICLDNCFLHSSHRAAGPSLDADILLAGAMECLGHESAATVRHWGLVAKEPLAYPDSVSKLAQAYHDTPENLRPGSLGVLTASIEGLKLQSPGWRSNPLSWVVVSVDPASTGLHPISHQDKLMAAAIGARECGGVGLACVNTTVKAGQIEQGLAIGRRAKNIGMDQFSIGGLYKMDSGKMEDTVSYQGILEMIDGVIAEFAGTTFEVAVNVSPERFLELFGGFEECQADFERWRLERWIAPNICVLTANPRPGHFLRLRWDGELLNYEDLMNFGRRYGKFGTYHSGRMQRMLSDLGGMRRQPWKLLSA